MAEVKWIKIVTDVFDNRKIKQIESMPDSDSILVIWFKILCLAGNINENGLLIITQDIPYTDEMLANEFKRPLSTIRMALSVFQNFDMIEVFDNVLCVSNWEKYQNIEGMDKIREQTRLRVAKHREKKRLEAERKAGNVTVTQGNATDISISNSLSNDLNINERNGIDNFFEYVWAMYPRKLGKGSVSNKTKKKMFELGDEVIRAVERYSDFVKGKDEQFTMYGSTFFNSGYVDYLDANYPDEPKGKQEDCWQ